MPRDRHARLVFILAVIVVLVIIGRNVYRRMVNNALVTAVRTTDVGAVQRLLRYGADPNYLVSPPSQDPAPAHLPPPKPILDLAFEKIADYVVIDSPASLPNSVSVTLDVPNMRAEQIVLLLIQYGANWKEGSYLATACSRGDVSLTRALLDRGIDADRINKSGALEAAIDYAATYSINTDNTGRVIRELSPQEKAAVARQREVRRALVQMLREHGAQPDLLQAEALGDRTAVWKLLAGGAGRANGDVTIFASHIVQTGDMEALKRLFELRGDLGQAPNMKVWRPIPHGFDYAPPLQQAVYSNRSAALKLLLEHGIDPNRESQSSSIPPLILAANRGNLEMVKLLLAHGAKVNPAGNNNPPLGSAMLAHSAQVNPAELDDSPLFQAVSGRRLDMARLLLTHGADVNQSIRGVPILTSALLSMPDIVPELLKRGAAVNAPDAINQSVSNNSGPVTRTPTPPIRTPLMAAVFEAPQFEAILVARGAKIGPDRASACIIAASQRRMDLLPKLLAYGADINGAIFDGQTVLHYCIDYAPEMVKMLLEHGANPNLGTMYSAMTPLQEAAMIGNLEVVRLLLAHGAQVNACIGRGHTALYWARKKNHADIVALLQRAGATE
jgi:ankyrin repeat protein